MNKHPRLAMLAMLAVGLALGSLAMYWKMAPGDIRRTSPPGVMPTSVLAADVPPEQGVVAAPGRVEPVSEEIFVGAEIPGALKEILVREGEHVRKGQPLASLVNDDLTAAVAANNAQLGVREAELQRIVNGARNEERREAAASVREAKAAVDNAQVELKRREQLLSTGDIAKSRVDLADRDFRMANEHLAAVQEHLALVEAPAREDEMARAQSAVAAARAAVREAEGKLAKTMIRSPIDGVVLRRNLKAGESISDPFAQPVFTLGDVSALRVRVEIDETNVGMVRVGQPAYITADAWRGRKFPGRVATVGQLVTPRKVRTDAPGERLDRKVLEALVDLDPGSGLPPGLRVDVFVEVRPDTRRPPIR